MLGYWGMEPPFVAIATNGVILCRTKWVEADHSPPYGGEMSSTDTLLQSHRVCTRRRSLTGWLWRVCISIMSDHSPPMEGWQA